MYNGHSGEATWDSFKSIIIPESPTASLSVEHTLILAIWWASPGLAQASPYVKTEVLRPRPASPRPRNVEKHRFGGVKT